MLEYSWFAPSLRLAPMASISSMNRIEGAIERTSANMSRTRAAPTPDSSWMKSVAATEMKAALASPARALASSVLPHPGGPDTRIPFGGEIPCSSNSEGSER